MSSSRESLTTLRAPHYLRKHPRISLLLFISIYVYIHFRYYRPLSRITPWLPLGLYGVSLEVFHVLVSLLVPVFKDDYIARLFYTAVTLALYQPVCQYYTVCVQTTWWDLPKIYLVPPAVSYVTVMLPYGFLPFIRLDEDSLVGGAQDEEGGVGMELESVGMDR